MNYWERGEVYAYHAENEQESPRLAFTPQEQEAWLEIWGGDTCGASLNYGERKAAIRSLIRRGYIGSCSVSGCRFRHYHILDEGGPLFRGEPATP
jgi:hypothetical protein